MDTKPVVKHPNLSTKDVESNLKEFNPFVERKTEHPTTDGETLTHLLKASLGTGILAMPMAFMTCGLYLGVIAAIITSIIVTHCNYILVKCAHHLYKRTRRTTMSFADVAEIAFATGPHALRCFAQFSRKFVIVSLFSAYFGSCSVYTIIVGQSTQQLISFYTGQLIDLRYCIVAFLIPYLLLSYIPNLKYLAPVSMIANIFMGTGLGITIYFLFRDLPPIDERANFRNFDQLPAFFGITVFALEAIGVIMPLENSMATPEHFIGIFGILNKGMAIVTSIYIGLGFLGYWCYGDYTLPSIPLNLPIEEPLAQVVKICIAAAVLCTFSLQLYVCVDLIWDANKHRFKKYSTLANYILRTIIVCSTVALAVCVPNIEPLIGLIGAFCFSLLGLAAPILIEMVTFWQPRSKQFNFIIIKSIPFLIIALIALIFGSISAVNDIIKMFS